MKKTLVIGASANPSRYSNMAIQRLVFAGHRVVAIGARPAVVYGVNVLTNPEPFKEIDTVTLYINPITQKQYYDYLLHLRPNRIIFNPGSENDEFEKLATAAGITVENACTLVMLSTDQF